MTATPSANSVREASSLEGSRPPAPDREALARRAAALNLPFLPELDGDADVGVLAKLPAADAARLGVMPVSLDGPVLTVATRAPDDLELERILAVLTGCEIEFVVSPAEAIEAALRRAGSATKALQDVSQEFRLDLVRENERGATETIELTEAAAEEAPVVRLVKSMLKAALERQASDIHIHTDADGTRIHFRIDGVLNHALGPFDRSYHAPLISRIKVMAELDIAEHRVPQDGRFKLRLRDGEVDFRVSVLPGAHGEDIVIRILDKSHLLQSQTTLSLDQLGFDAEASGVLSRLVRSPFGLLLVTGPTGSGKTTTLYACIAGLDHTQEKIITIEDPVEYELPGILQVPVNEKKNLTFVRGLRSILRHDPDRIMVGEIRDRETASIAVQAALTGHLVITTLHANNAFDVIARFTHMQIDLYELTAALNCVVAQRLVRKLCPQCKGPVRHTADTVAALGLSGQRIEDRVCFDAPGCDACYGTGYKGRTVVAEILELAADLKQVIIERRPLADIRAAAQAAGMNSMREAALAKAFAGVTSLAEVVRVT